jgi:hypothetical protein
MQSVDRRIAASYGFALNQNGGLYCNGESYDILTKIRVSQAASGTWTHGSLGGA